MDTIIFQCFSIIVFVASIIYIIMQFSYESKLTEIILNIKRTPRRKRLGEEELDEEIKDEVLTSSNVISDSRAKINILKDIKESYSSIMKSIDDSLSQNTKLFLKIAFIVLATRLLIYAFGYYGGILASGGPISYEATWVRWDAQHYLKLAKEWYMGGTNTEIFIVFYPLYPFLVKMLSVLTGTVFVSSMILSNLFLIIGCYYMYKLFAFEYDGGIAVNGLKYLLFFPVSFFLCAPFTESLFIMLSVMMFYYLRKEKWFLSAVIGMFAGLTRFHGILLLIPFIIEYFVQCNVFKNMHERKFKVVLNDFMKKGIFAVIIPMGFGLYLVLNKIVTGEWFKFLYWQKEHWHQSFKIFYDGSIISLMSYATSSTDNFDKASLWIPQIIILIVAFIAIIYAMKMKMRASYFAYMTIYIFSTISLTYLLSAPRYIMAAFPIYIVAAKMTTKNKKIDIVLTFASLLFLMYCLFAYVSGKRIM